jgi:hypothetical protein
MALDNAAITAGTTPTKLAEFDTGVYLVNNDTQPVFVGGPRVATSGANAGISVAAAGTLTVRAKGTLYAVSTAGTSANAVKVLSS